jgi:hypothetical protein
VTIRSGSSGFVAHHHLGLGRLYRRTGKHEHAREHLATATTMYRAMDMRFWLEQAEADAGVGMSVIELVPFLGLKPHKTRVTGGTALR